ncbi:MAG: acylphosphatase [Candidatus Andersenbacteria bacterium]
MTESTKAHLTIRIYGKVQGVFFRAQTAAFARSHKLTGVVRNEPDGSVYLEAEGQPQDLELLKTWCNSGPSRAEVTRCVVANGQPKGYKTFEVERS